MKKSIVALCLMLGFSGAFAVDKSGFFGGAGIGLQGMKQVVEYSAANFSSTRTTRYPSLSVFAGYKFMQDEADSSFAKFGVRVYANYEYNPVNEIYILRSYDKQETNKLYHIIGLNADYLFNFTDKFGAFFGANFAVVAWDELFSLDGKSDYDGYFAYQLGLRTALKDMGEVELLVKFPLAKTEQTSSTYNGITNTLQQTYNVALRYVINF